MWNECPAKFDTQVANQFFSFTMEKLTISAKSLGKCNRAWAYLMIVSAALFVALECISLLMLLEKKVAVFPLTKVSTTVLRFDRNGDPKQIKRWNNWEAMVIAIRHSSAFKYTVKDKNPGMWERITNFVCFHPALWNSIRVFKHTEAFSTKLKAFKISGVILLFIKHTLMISYLCRTIWLTWKWWQAKRET